MTRCEKLASALPEGVDCVIIESEINRRYFSSFPASDGLLIITREYAILGMDGRYIEAARAQAKDVDVLLITGYMEFLRELLSKLSVKTVAVEGINTLSRIKTFRDAMPDIDFDSYSEIDEKIKELRMVKDADETEKTAQAQEIADFAFDNILKFIKPGVTEREIAVELEYFMKKHGSEKESFETIAVSGKRTSMPHGVPTDKPVEDGDFVTMDYGATVDGYHSDMTRTVAVGHVTDEMKTVYELVLSAQKAGLAALRPEVTCNGIDKISRDIIKDGGYGEYFTHSTGHGVGLEIHEFPTVSVQSPYVLAPGHIVTVEPGIYLPGRFGVRIEDFAVITESGCRNFTHAPKELIVL